MNPIDWLTWFNGKKTKIGGVLFLLTTAVSFFVGWLPGLQASLVDVGFPVDQTAAVFAFVTKAFLLVGSAHALWKKFWNLPDEAPLNRQGGYSRTSIMGILALVTASILAFGACNKVPPNLSPFGATAYRLKQVVVSLDSLGDVAVKVEKSGFIEHKDTLLVADVVARSARAAADLGRAFQAGDGTEYQRARVVATIKKALQELPGNLSPRARDVLQPYIDLAIQALELVK